MGTAKGVGEGRFYLFGEGRSTGGGALTFTGTIIGVDGAFAGATGTSTLSGRGDTRGGGTGDYTIELNWGDDAQISLSAPDVLGQPSTTEGTTPTIAVTAAGTFENDQSTWVNDAPEPTMSLEVDFGGQLVGRATTWVNMLPDPANPGDYLIQTKTDFEGTLAGVGDGTLYFISEGRLTRAGELTYVGTVIGDNFAFAGVSGTITMTGRGDVAGFGSGDFNIELTIPEPTPAG